MTTPIDAILDSLEWTPIPFVDDTGNHHALPHATHSGVLQVGEIELRCYRLSNGQRVFDADDIEQFFGAVENSSAVR